MNDTIPATTDTVHRQRATALTTLTQLADQHGLPTPMSVTFSKESESRQRLTVRLDDDRPRDVKDWADVLGLGEVRSMAIPACEDGEAFASIHAEADSFGGPLWLGFDRISVWSKCEPDADTRTDTPEDAR